MKIKKILMLITTIAFLTGCSAEYNINIEDEVLTENINIYVSNNNADELDSLDYYLNNDIISFSANEDEYYYSTEEIEESDKTGINLRFEYEDIVGYALSGFFKECFQKSSISSDENNIYIKATGFSCYDYNYFIVDDAVINLTTNHKVTEHNADKVSDNIYSWNIIETGKDITLVLEKQANKDNVTEEDDVIIVEDDKTEDESSFEEETENKLFSWIIVGLLFVVFIAAIFLVIILKINKGQRS